MKIDFRGAIPGSKSILNRALIVQSYFPALNIHGDSDCDDVRYMKKALQVPMQDRNTIDCGEGGTTFRFLTLRASRFPGVHALQGSSRLFQRPTAGLINLLRQLGVQVQVKSTGLLITGEGWKQTTGVVQVETSESSQYASALLLNSWLLDFDLEFELVGDKVSESYFMLTLEMVQKLGMRIQKNGNRYFVPAGERIGELSWQAEPDISSVFTMAAAGALAGRVQITNFESQSQQPDIIFLDIFKRMNVDFKIHENELEVRQSPGLKPIEENLFQAPDLFPVLAVLCSFAEGPSKLFGAPQLAHKESNRIQAVSRLFQSLEIQHEVLTGGMIIHGKKQRPKTGLVFNPDQDHRLVMAAALMKLKGHEIKIEEPEAINKSFPEFWQFVGIQP